MWRDAEFGLQAMEITLAFFAFPSRQGDVRMKGTRVSRKAAAGSGCGDRLLKRVEWYRGPHIDVENARAFEEAQ